MVNKRDINMPSVMSVKLNLQKKQKTWRDFISSHCFRLVKIAAPFTLWRKMDKSKWHATNAVLCVVSL